VQRHIGPATLLLDLLDGVFTAAARLPPDAMLFRKPAAPRGECHPVSDDERGVEADPELADQVRVAGLVAGQALEKLPRARLGDGADVLDHLLARHADAVVRHRNDSGLGVVAHADFQFGVVLEQRLVGERLEPQLVGGIGGVGNQLAQENLLVAVQGVDHQVEQLLDFGLEAERILGRHVVHSGLRVRIVLCMIGPAGELFKPSRCGLAGHTPTR
jgi:hypothetical protein